MYILISSLKYFCPGFVLVFSKFRYYQFMFRPLLLGREYHNFRFGVTHYTNFSSSIKLGARSTRWRSEFLPVFGSAKMKKDIPNGCPFSSRPWTLSTTCQREAPLEWLLQTPPPPSTFEGAPSPVGVKQTSLFECQEGLGIVTLSIP